MTIGEFLKENKLSVGDNFKFLLEKLGIYQEEFVKKVESAVGETAKMSKSKANTVDPEDMVNSYGADTVRLYVLFAGPVEKDFEWTEEGLQGAHRFLKRLWGLFHENLERLRDLQYTREELSRVEGVAREVRKKAHQTLKKYLQDMEELSFNTAIAGIMELLNTLQDFKPETQTDHKVLKEALELILFMLYPITPHICEELWNRLGNQRLMVFYTFPQPDPEALKEEEVEIAVQVNGKLKAVVKVPIDAQEDAVKSIVLAQEKVAKALENKKLQKVVYVKNKLINLVVRDG
ncbi:class I tRNA ligase family protein [Thermocrinis sp.]|jgi:leucyl-tRNA synthetase|uniref:class I tRNA ligase family protein n=1 Tax=Thermocrinis sp. TaxID=2024383 RepID=UPI003C0CBDAB